MASGRKKKPTKQPAAKSKANQPAPVVERAVTAPRFDHTPHRSRGAARPGEAGACDARPYIYLGLNQVFVVLYVIVLLYVIPNRLMSATVHLWALPVLMQLMAIGMASIFLHPDVRRIGWWLAMAAASLLVLITIMLIIRVLVSAAFLSGVYGAFGKAAALSALIGVALVVEAVALLPLFQIKYLMTRAGRRVYSFA